MTKNIFVRKKSDARETGQSGPAQFFLATVASVTAAEGVSIIPDGQTEAVAKKYKVLTAGTAPPAVGDRVVVMRHSGTCVILGAIGEPEDMDADARITDIENEITDIDTELGKKVAKAGDTMTGNLIMDGAEINLRSITNTIGIAPAETVSDRRIYFRDKANTLFGKLQSVFSSNGSIGMQLGIHRAVNGSTVENNLILYIDASGNRSVSITSPQTWRHALGLGTSGAFPITVAQGGTGATSAAGHAVFAGPNGSTAGAPSFRALSADDITAGTLPIGRGGTGSTGTSTVTTLANIATAGTGVTLLDAAFSHWGKLAMLYVHGKTTAAITGPGVLFTVASGKRPVSNAAVQIGRSPDHNAVIGTNGQAQLGGSLSSGSEFVCMSIYLLP